MATGFGVAPPPHDPSMPFRGSSKPAKSGGKKAAGKPANFHLPTPTAAGAATGPFPPPPAPTGDAALIQQMIAAAQLPQMQAIQNAQAASIMAARNSAASSQGYYKALAGILQGIGPETRAGYQAAAADDSAFGKGFANGLTMVQDQAGGQTNDALGVAGAPAAQTAQATGALGGSGATDALYALGGYIPATTMSREGAAFGATADRLPATAAGQGAEAIQGIGQQQRLDQQGFAKNYADLAAQVPGLSLQIGQQLATQHNADRTFRLNEAKANAADVYRTSMLQLQYIAQTGMDPVTHKLTPKAQLEWDKTMNNIKVANERVGIAQQNADSNSSRATTAADKARGYTVDAQGIPHALAGFTMNADGTATKNASKWTPGQPVVSSVGTMRVNGYTEAEIDKQLRKWHPNWTAAQIAATLKAAPKLYGDMTKTQVEALRALAGGLRHSHVFSPKDTKQTVTIGGVTYKSGQKIPAVSFKVALSYLIGRGYSRTDATAMLNRFYPRGKKK